MKYFSWNSDKNELLKKEREVSFEDVVLAIEQGGLLDILEHPNPDAYPGQRLFVVQIGEYAYLVPYVEDEHEVFLKTIIPSRRATKTYLK
jgi:putative transposon-encoded protein